MHTKLRNTLVTLLIGGCLSLITMCMLAQVCARVSDDTPVSTTTRVPTPTDTRITSTLPIGATITSELTKTATLVPTVVIQSTPTPSVVPPTPVPPVPAPPVPTVVACDCSGDIYNCSDFIGHTPAQVCYEHCVSIGRGDIHRLDRDNDDIACERN